MTLFTNEEEDERGKKNWDRYESELFTKIVNIVITNRFERLIRYENGKTEEEEEETYDVVSNIEILIHAHHTHTHTHYIYIYSSIDSFIDLFELSSIRSLY